MQTQITSKKARVIPFTSKKARVIALAALATASLSAHADPFTDAMTDITAKVTEYGGALVGLAAVGVVFMVAIKYVKKIRGAA